MREIYACKAASFYKFGAFVYFVGISNNFGYIFMEKLHKSLALMIRTSELKIRHVESFINTLFNMWKNGKFIHLDLHCDNIWFDLEGNAKLIDFGLIVENWEMCRLTCNEPYMKDTYNHPPIIDCNTALYNSVFDIREFLNTYCSKNEAFVILNEVVNSLNFFDEYKPIPYGYYKRV